MPKKNNGFFKNILHRLGNWWEVFGKCREQTKFGPTQKTIPHLKKRNAKNSCGFYNLVLGFFSANKKFSGISDP